MPRVKKYNFDAQAERAYKAWLRDRPELISWDTETSGLTWHDSAFCVTIGWENEQHYIELGDFVREMQVSTILRDTPKWVLHNAKFDFEKLLLLGLIERKDITYNRYHDTEMIAHLIDENRPKGLKPLAESVLGKKTDEAKALQKERRRLKLKKEDGYDKLSREFLVPYAIKDARFTFDLYRTMEPMLSDGVRPLYDQERKLGLVLLDMEFKGLAVRLEYVQNKVKEYGFILLKSEMKLRSMTGKEDFKPKSTPQIKEALAQRGLFPADTEADTLKKIDDAFCREILHFRKYNKLRNTYLVNMVKEYDNGILHPWIRQMGTVTGRAASGGASNN
jgi:DNA polymerase I-like protein with 3'-5' exonuclease and polymerase domains